MFPALMTSAHFFVSSRIMRENASGEAVKGSVPASTAILRISCALSAAAISSLRRATIGRGVAAGATTPNQPIAS